MFLGKIGIAGNKSLWLLRVEKAEKGMVDLSVSSKSSIICCFIYSISYIQNLKYILVDWMFMHYVVATSIPNTINKNTYIAPAVCLLLFHVFHM